MTTRREFTRFSAAALAGMALPDVLRSAWPAPAVARWPGYERAIVIDNLATPGPFNVPNMFEVPWTDAMVANARASGITAVNVTLSGGASRGAAAFENSVRALAFMQHELDAHPRDFAPIRTVADIRAAKQSGKLGLIAGFQDATMLEADLSRVNLFGQLGVRIIQLTYNVRNLLGDGCLEPGDAGLSTFGRQVVERMNALGILVDLSHCGRRTTLDAVTASSKPVAYTHTACAALADLPRNKNDEQLRKLADRGGVAGIYLMPFLRTSGQPMTDDLVRHVEHAIRICGEDHVGIGSDNSITPLDITPEFRRLHAGFVQLRRRQGISAPGEAEDVYNYVPDLNVPRRMERIADALAARGHPAARVEKVLGGNWLRLFGDVWRAPA